MKTIYIKINSAGRCQPAHPLYMRHGLDVQTYRVDNVPDDITAAAVAIKLDQVATWPASGYTLDDLSAWVIDWSILAAATPGQIIRTGGAPC